MNELVLYQFEIDTATLYLRMINWFGAIVTLQQILVVIVK